MSVRTEGTRSAVGLPGAVVDPKSPAADVLGDAEPCADLWFYTNPIWLIPKGVTVTALHWRTTGEAEHAMLGLTELASHPDLIMATHFVDGAVVVTAQADGPVEVWGPAGAAAALAEPAERHTARRSGRLFRFPGVDDLVGGRRGRSDDGGAADGPLGGRRRRHARTREPLGPEAVVDTQEFVRPHFVDGRVVLDVRPASDGVAVPFERRHPTPCCADH